MNDALARFVILYLQLDKHQLHRLPEVYADEVLFIDPAHRIEGLAALTRPLLFSKQNPDIDIGSAGGAWAQMECHGSTGPAVVLTATASARCAPRRFS